MTQNIREAGCSEISTNRHEAVEKTKWFTTVETEVENADGTKKIKTQKQLVTDPVTKSALDKLARTILDICTYDPKSGHFHVFRTINGANKWSECAKVADAIAYVHQELSRQPHTPTKEFITDVLKKPELFPFCGGDDMAPFAGPTFIRDGIMYRNTFRDSGVPVDPTPITDAEKDLLTDLMGGIIRTNLCNLRGQKTFDELVAIIHDTANDAEFSFRYLMHNIAVNYMRPGYNIRTNLALVGQPGGMGKNYLAEIVKRMLGTDLVTSPSDPTSKFNDWMVGASLVVWNEIEDCTYDKTFNTMVKKITVDSTVSINKKQATQRTIPNMTNHWFFSNQLTPYKLDATDRRTIFVRTFNGDFSENDDRKAFADSFSSTHNDTDVARVFAKFLHTVELDFAVLKYRQTDVAKDAIEQSASFFEEFIREESLAAYFYTDATRDTKTRKYITVKVKELLDAYRSWCAENGLKVPRRTDVSAGLKAMSACFTKSNNRWFVEPGLLRFRNGVPYNTSLDNYTASQASYQATHAPTPLTPVTQPTLKTVQPIAVNGNGNAGSGSGSGSAVKHKHGQELVDEIKKKRGLQ